MADLEQTVTEGRCAYISRLAYDEQEKTLTLDFVRLPSKPAYGTLTFRNVEAYSSVLHYEEDRADFEAGTLNDSLIGLDEHLREGKMWFVIATDAREITFFSATEPAWTRHLQADLL